MLALPYFHDLHTRKIFQINQPHANAYNSQNIKLFNNPNKKDLNVILQHIYFSPDYEMS